MRTVHDSQQSENPLPCASQGRVKDLGNQTLQQDPTQTGTKFNRFIYRRFGQELLQAMEVWLWRSGIGE